MSAIVVRKVATEEEAHLLATFGIVSVAVVDSSEESKRTRFSVMMRRIQESDLPHEVEEETDFHILPEAVKCLPGFRVTGCVSKGAGEFGASWSLMVDVPSGQLMTAFLNK